MAPRMWLYGVARRQLANQRRGDRRRSALASELAGALRSVTPPDDGSLAAALATLDETDRELIMLSAWDGLTSAEIGELLGIRAATVRVRLHRARRRLERELEPPSARRERLEEAPRGV